MKDYAKAINTIKALNEAFGSEEFTRKDYNEMMKDHVSEYYTSPMFGPTNKPKEYDVYSSTNALKLDCEAPLVEKIREEEIWVRTDDDTKKKAKRFYYKANTDALVKIVNWMLRDAKLEEQRTKGMMTSAEVQRAKSQRGLEYYERKAERSQYNIGHQTERIEELEKKLAQVRELAEQATELLNK